MLGKKQAPLLMQLAAGYMVASPKDPYAALRRKGYVEDSVFFTRGDVEYQRASGKRRPRVTREGMAALRAYVQKHGRLEIEMFTPGSPFTTVIRLDPVSSTSEVSS